MSGFEAQGTSVDVSYLAQIQCKEDRLKFIFSPLEKYICFLESVLTWEYPVIFVLLIAVINFLFWIYSITPVYCLISVVGFTALGIQFLINHVFPLFTETDASEEWVRVRNADNNLDLLHCLAVVMARFENVYKLLEHYKKDNRDKFNLLGILTCILLLLSGCIIDESHLVYCLAMGTLLWPGMKYNKINDRIYNKTKPYFDQFEQTMRICRTVSMKDGTGDGEDSDVELQQFIPTKEVDDSVSSINVGNEDESDTNDDFMPQAAEADSDITDDELLSDDLKLTAQDKKAIVQKTEDAEVYSSSESETGSICGDDAQLRSLDFSDVIQSEGPSIEPVETFSKGLSFEHLIDDEDDGNAGGSIRAEQKMASGFFGKSYSRLASLYRTVNAYVPASFHLSKSKEVDKDETDDAKRIDDEFDFLNQELEDVNEA